MMREQEQKTYARLGECLREAGFTGISLSLTENRSRLTAVRKQPDLIFAILVTPPFSDDICFH